MSQEAKKTECTQGQAVKAHSALLKLYNQDIPSTEAFDVFLLTQKLAPIADFQGDQRQKIIADMKPEIREGGRVLDFGSPERLKEYQDKIAALEEMPADLDTEPIEIQLSSHICIAPADIEVLERLGFVRFHKA